MSRFTFVHAADLHLDTPFDALGPVPEHVALALRDASLDAWSALVDLTIDRNAAGLLLAGDIYDGEQRGLRAQARFRSGLDELSARGVQVFLVHGNHDPLDGWSGIPRWPARVTLFPSEDVTSVDLKRDGQHLATVHGISYARRDCAENLAQRFRRGSAPGLHIGVLHANVGGNIHHAPCSPCSVEDLRRAGMDYWALGHIERARRAEAGARRARAADRCGATQFFRIAVVGRAVAVVVDAVAHLGARDEVPARALSARPWPGFCSGCRARHCALPSMASPTWRW
jgi:DNA repair exonuclease SbcCD nuclease subunit